MSKYSGKNNNYNWILTILDIFTKKAYTFALKNKEAVTVTNAIKQWLDTLPQTPKILQFNRGPEFVNDVLQQLLKSKNIHQLLSDPYNPQTQGSIERFNGTLKRMIHSYFTSYNQTI